MGIQEDFFCLYPSGMKGAGIQEDFSCLYPRGMKGVGIQEDFFACTQGDCWRRVSPCMSVVNIAGKTTQKTTG